jgi:AmiR/NasT family two-component response regulator
MSSDLEDCEENLELAQKETQQLRQAIETRAPIEQAKGMLKLLLNCEDDFAFEVLTRVSQTTHTKLQVVASGLCEALTDSDDVPPEFTKAYQQLSERDRS